MATTMSNKKQFIRFILVLFSGITCFVQAYALIPNIEQKNHLIPSVAQTKARHNREIIVLVHGLLRTSLSMWPLKIYLKKQGYRVYSYSYPSPKYSIAEHGFYLSQFINNLLVTNPGVKINFITHSLGGIITRESLATLSKKQLKNIGCLIMLAPPNQGSELAKLSIRTFPMITKFVKPLAELSSDHASYVHHVPIPKIKIGIIAGRYDAKVPPDSARLLGQRDPIIVNSNHTFIMNNTKTKQLIMSFLEKGSFGKLAEQ